MPIPKLSLHLQKRVEPLKQYKRLLIGKLDPLSLGDFYLTTMTREEKIISAMCDNLSTKGNVVSGLTKSAADISQLFDEEMIELAEWKDAYTTRNPYHESNCAELLQLFKNRC